MSHFYCVGYNETEDCTITETSLIGLSSLTAEVSPHQVYSIDIVT
jgi:hypothetical protein